MACADNLGETCLTQTFAEGARAAGGAHTGGRAMDDSGITQALPVLSERLQKKSRWGADRRREEASCRLCTGLSPEGIWGP